MPSTDDILDNIRAMIKFIGAPDWRGENAEWILSALVEDLRLALKEALEKAK